MAGAGGHAIGNGEAGRGASTADRRAAFEVVFRAHFDTVLAFARRRTDGATAHDVASEVFLVAWRRLDDVPGEPATRGWLFGCARRILANKRRGSARERALVEKIRAHTPARSVDHAGSATETDRVRAAFAGLSAGDREVLALVTADGLTHREASAILGVRENTFTVRYQRARRRLRSALDGADQRRPRVVGGSS